MDETDLMPAGSLSARANGYARCPEDFRVQISADRPTVIEIALLSDDPETPRMLRLTIQGALECAEQLLAVTRQAQEALDQAHNRAQLQLLGWHETHATAALREGWTLSAYAPGQYRLERTIAGPFASQAQLMAHVREQSARGSPMHARALILSTLTHAPGEGP
jgi:hypothetical protein